MRRAVVLLMLGLTSCQIIINHNTFEPASDAATPPNDTAPDTEQPPPANAVRSTSGQGVQVVFAQIDGNGDVLDDGGWLLSSVPTNDTANKVFHHAMTFRPFTTAPNCACTSGGGNNHGCFFSNVGTSSATVSVFDLTSGITSRPVSVMCVGPTADTRPDLATNPSSGSIVLAQSRIDRATGGQMFEAGNWITSGTSLGGGVVELGFASVFAEDPVCNCTQTIDAAGTSSSNCKIEIPATASGMTLASSADPGGGGNPFEFEIACIGRSTTDDGPFVVSPDASGALIATATINGSTNMVVRQDGSWIQSVTGGDSNSVTYDVAVFGGPPSCLCASLEDRVACRIGSTPNETNVQLEMNQQATNAPGVDGVFSLICIGPPP